METTRITNHVRCWSVCVVLFVLLCSQVNAKVIRIDVTKRVDWMGGRSFGKAGVYELVQGTVYYAVDPNDKANATITDIALAPRNAAGLVEFSGDFVMLRPKDPAKARRTVVVEVPNRGITQLHIGLFIPKAGSRFDLTNLSAVTGLEDAFIFEQGYTVAWVGWQFDVVKGQGLRLDVPVIDVSGLVRASYIPQPNKVENSFSLKTGQSGYCATDTTQPDTQVTVRQSMDGPATVIPRSAWRFARQDSVGVTADPCSIRLAQPLESGKLYEVVYQAKGSPVAGLGFAAVRDFVAYLKHGGTGAPEQLADTTLRKHPETLAKVIGFGYSQSARYLRNFLYDGFNADEQSRPVFDGLLVAAAGAGRGDFNHRFAVPGVAGNSVLSILRPVDLFPFTDSPEIDPVTGERAGLLDRAEAQRAVPKIFYTYSSSEYWARVGSLAHTSLDGSRDLPLHPQTRLYFIAGTPHAGPPRLTRKGPPGSGQEAEYFANVGYWQGYAQRAFLLNLDDWVSQNVSPPPSVYPTLRMGQLVSLWAVRFPKLPNVEFPTYMPQNWRMDFGKDFQRTGVITSARPALGQPYTVLVPQVDAEGNEQSGIRLPHITVPLATYTGWNYVLPRQPSLGYLAGLSGSALPFPRTAEERTASQDSRLSIMERYGSREEYLRRVRDEAGLLVKQRFLWSGDIESVVEVSGWLWDHITTLSDTAIKR